ncbi:hypothetical protein FACS189475_06620 [Betaproteobacteria bacterium]|nr:hypothetical protein FACS189475_06620 [Betaproteobacteria bacterium]
MDTRSGIEHRFGGRVVHLPDAVDERPGGIDDAAGANGEFLAADAVAYPRAAQAGLKKAGEGTWELFYKTVPNAKEILDSVNQYR